MNKFLTAVIFVVVSVVLVTSVLLPVVQDAEDSQKLTYNNNAYRADLVGSEVVTYSWDAATGTTIGDDTITANTNFGPQVLLATDSGFIKANYANTSVSFYEFDGSVGAGANITALTISVDPSTKTVTISDVTASSTVPDTTFNYAEWAFVPAVAGNYVYWAPYSTSKIIHAEADKDSYAVFRSGTTWAMSFKGETQTASLNDTAYTADFAGEAVDGYSELVDYDILASTGDYYIEVGGTNYTAEALVFDRTATGISDDNGDGIISLFSIIPILIIAGVMLAVVRLLIMRQD